MAHVQDHHVKYRNRNNFAVYCSILLKFGREFDHINDIIADTLQMFRIKCQKSRLEREHYKTATDRLTDLKLDMGISVKVENNWRGIGWFQVAMHSSCHIF